VRLFDLDADQMRKKLPGGITQPNNDSLLKINHTVCARAEVGAPDVRHVGTTLPGSASYQKVGGAVHGGTGV
jgi:hypothetical protein